MLVNVVLQECSEQLCRFRVALLTLKGKGLSQFQLVVLEEIHGYSPNRILLIIADKRRMPSKLVPFRDQF